MADLPTILKIRDEVRLVCEAIDAGTVHPTELEMLALANLVALEAGPLRHDLITMLASRCEEGRAVLKKIAQ